MYGISHHVRLSRWIALLCSWLVRVICTAVDLQAFAQQFTNVSGLFALGELPTASDSLQGVLGPVVNYMNPAAGLGLLDFFSVDPIRAVFLGEWR